MHIQVAHWHPPVLYVSVRVFVIKRSKILVHYWSRIYSSIDFMYITYPLYRVLEFFVQEFEDVVPTITSLDRL